MLDLLDLLTALSFRPFVAPYRPGGTPLHVLGFLGKFEKVAKRNARRLQALQRMGIDPAMTLPYRGEYRNVLQDGAPKVRLLQEWLSSRLDDLPQHEAAGEAHLMPHCSESAIAKVSLSDWTAVFKRFGLQLEVVPVGCCGMAGNYGHEAEHAALSRAICDSSWGKQVLADKPNLMAMGFSCRAQAERFSGGKLPHPVQVPLATVRTHGTRASGHR